MKEGLASAAEPDGEEAVVHVNDDGTPSCVACGEKNIGFGTEALLLLRGSWLPDTKTDVAAFIVDAETRLHIEQLPNGQLMIISDVHGHPTKHAHLECVRDLVNDRHHDWIEEEDEDDEEEE